MRRLVLSLVFLGFASTASAQATCPTGPSSITVSSQAPLKVFWCSPQANAITGANVYGLPVSKIPVNSINAIGGPFGDGQMQYQGAIPAQPKGTYSVTVKAVNLGIPGDSSTLQEGATSSPFVLTSADPLAAPSAPSNFYLSK